MIEILMLVNLKFTFTLFPFYFRNNDAMDRVVEKRSIRMKGRYKTELEALFYQVS